MSAYINDAELKVIGFRLFQELKSNATKGTYVRFHPQSIEIIGKSNVRFKTDPISTDLRGALRWLGVTLYHLKTGQSEFNNSVLRNDPDGYKPIESELWPVISLMLSGESFNLPAIEVMLRGETITSQMKKKLLPLWQWLMMGLLWVWNLVVGLVSWAIRKITRLVSKIWEDIDVCLILGILVIAIIIGIAYVIYFWHFFSGLRLIGTMLLYWFLSLVVWGISIAVIAENYEDVRVRGNNTARKIVAFIAFAVFVLVVNGLLAMVGFLAPVYANGSMETTGVSNNPVLVDRRDGQFISRLQASASDTLLAYQGNWINWFKVRVVDGLAPERSLQRDLGNNLFLNVYYKLSTKDKYLAGLEKWTSQSQLDTAINEAVDKLLPTITGKIREVEQISKSSVSEGCQLNITWTVNLDDSSKKEIEASIRKTFDELLAQYTIKQYFLNLNQALPAISAEVRSGLAGDFEQYFDEFEVNMGNQSGMPQI